MHHILVPAFFVIFFSVAGLASPCASSHARKDQVGFQSAAPLERAQEVAHQNNRSRELSSLLGPDVQRIQAVFGKLFPDKLDIIPLERRPHFSAFFKVDREIYMGSSLIRSTRTRLPTLAHEIAHDVFSSNILIAIAGQRKTENEWFSEFKIRAARVLGAHWREYFSSTTDQPKPFPLHLTSHREVLQLSALEVALHEYRRKTLAFEELFADLSAVLASNNLSAISNMSDELQHRDFKAVRPFSHQAWPTVDKHGKPTVENINYTFFDPVRGALGQYFKSGRLRTDNPTLVMQAMLNAAQKAIDQRLLVYADLSYAILVNRKFLKLYLDEARRLQIFYADSSN